ncbi:MAG: hypothetical protein U0003_01010 [Vampirovibrionales bacterium]
MKPSLTPSALAPQTVAIPLAQRPSTGNQLAHWVFHLPQTIQSSPRFQQNNRLSRWVRQALTTITHFDHSESISIGRVRLSVPSKGAFFFLVIPLTVIPRVYQAFTREDNRHQWTELGDILRRDMTTLFSLLYAFDPFQTWLAKVRGKNTGITLVNPYNQKTILNSADTERLYALKESGDLERLLKPLSSQSRGFVTPEAVIRELGKTGRELQRWINRKLSALQLQGSTTHLSQQALTQAQTLLNQLLQKDLAQLTQRPLAASDSTILAKLAQLDHQLAPWANETPLLRHSLMQAANRIRMPISLGAFILVCGLIGIAPDVFNKTWNQRRDRRQQQQHQQAQGQALLTRLTPSLGPLTNPFTQAAPSSTLNG